MVNQAIFPLFNLKACHYLPRDSLLREEHIILVDVVERGYSSGDLLHLIHIGARDLDAREKDCHRRFHRTVNSPMTGSSIFEKGSYSQTKEILIRPC